MVCSKPCWFLYMLWIIIYLWIAFHFHCFYHITCRCEWELRILNLCVFVLEMYTLKKFNQNTTTTTTKTIIFVFCSFVCLSYKSVDCICDADVESYTQLLNISWFHPFGSIFFETHFFPTISHSFTFFPQLVFSNQTAFIISCSCFGHFWYALCYVGSQWKFHCNLLLTTVNILTEKRVCVGLNLRFWLSFLPLTSVIFWIIHN